MPSFFVLGYKVQCIASEVALLLTGGIFTKVVGMAPGFTRADFSYLQGLWQLAIIFKAVLLKMVST